MRGGETRPYLPLIGLQLGGEESSGGQSEASRGQSGINCNKKETVWASLALVASH